MSSLSNITIGLVGAGNLGEALLRGWIAAGADPARILVTTATPARRSQVAGVHGVRALASNGELAKLAEVVVVAVKPDAVAGVLAELRNDLPANVAVISVAAGVPIIELQQALESPGPIVRAMPNAPSRVRAGVTPLYAPPETDPRAKQLADALFSAVGEVAWLAEETLIDIVTGLTGSGPAFLCLVAEAMADGAVRAGLPRPLAQRLAAATLRGTGIWLAEGTRHPAELRDQVTSPNGTTAAGLAILERGSARGVIADAVAAAAARAAELARKNR